MTDTKTEPHRLTIERIRQEAGKAKERYTEHRNAISEKQLLEARVLGEALAAALEGLPAVVSLVPQFGNVKLLALDTQGNASNAVTLWVDANAELYTSRHGTDTLARIDSTQAMERFRLQSCIQVLLAELSKSMYRQVATQAVKDRIVLLEMVHRALGLAKG